MQEIESIMVRGLQVSDLQAAKPLLQQLGYEIGVDELSQRRQAIESCKDHEVLIAELEGIAVGLIHIFVRPALEKPVEVIVQALVVDANFRGQGVGRTLMSEAETWAMRRGLRSIALYTGSHRAAARDFYRRIGFDHVVSADLMRKKIPEA